MWEKRSVEKSAGNINDRIFINLYLYGDDGRVRCPTRLFTSWEGKVPRERFYVNPKSMKTRPALLNGKNSFFGLPGGFVVSWIDNPREILRKQVSVPRVKNTEVRVHTREYGNRVAAISHAGNM
jgi:hypothetical protein